MSEWRASIRSFLLQLQSAGYSDRTLEATAFWLKHFLTWSYERGLADLTGFTAADGEAFREYVQATPGRRAPRRSEGSVQQAMYVVRGLFRWAAKRELVLFNPMAEMVIGRDRPELGTLLSIEQVAILLDAAEDGTLFGIRDRAVMETFYGTGIRRTELITMKTSDLDLQARKLRVMGKGAVERFAPVGETLAAVLERYLRDCRPQLARCHGDEALFVTAYGQHFSDSGLSGLMERVSRRVGMRVMPHMLRHAFARHLLECGADFYEVQRLLGHRSPQSTEIYTPIERAVFSRKHRACHPRGRQVTQKLDMFEGDDE